MGGCLQDWTIGRWDEARNYLQEVATSTPPDQWSKKAEFELRVHNDVLRGWQLWGPGARDQRRVGSADPKAVAEAENRLLETARSQGRTAFDSFVSGFGADKAAAADHLEKLWPQLKQRYPEAAPKLLADLVSFLVSTNSPIIAEFRQSVAGCVEHPEKVPDPRAYFYTVAAADYDWCMNRKLYSLAVELLQAKRDVGLKSPDLPFDEKNKVGLAFAYAKLKRWREALTLFEELGETPIDMDRLGPWGDPFKPFPPAAAAAACRAKLNLPPVKVAGRFDFGSPCLCLHTPSAFAAAEGGLWVAISGRLLQLDLNLATNLQVALPMDEGVPITTLCTGPERVWIGTQGAGLIEYNKSTRNCRLLTEAEGLLRNEIACLYQREDGLWIGCGRDTGYNPSGPGGLARLDPVANRLSAFTPSLPEDPLARASRNPFETADPSDGPPAHVIARLAGGVSGEVWLLAGDYGLRRYVPARGSWGPPPGDLDGKVVALAGDGERLVAGLGFAQVTVGVNIKPAGGGTNGVLRTNFVVSAAELHGMLAHPQPGWKIVSTSSYTSRGDLRDKGGLALYSLREGRWLGLLDNLRLPAPPTRVFVDGTDVWVGGWGYVAVVDTSLKSVRSLCYISSRTVDQLQVAGGYLWAQFDKHLYKVPLSATR